MSRKIKKWSLHILVWIAGLGVWHLLSLAYGPDILPGPIYTAKGGYELLTDGTLIQYIGISSYRVLLGWTLGSLIAIPAGLIIGKVGPIRAFAEPFLNFIRFIPPIAFITLFLVWFGIGETSKVMLILYATFFIVVLNTLTGVLSVEEDKIRSARSMGHPSGRLCSCAACHHSCNDPIYVHRHPACHGNLVHGDYRGRDDCFE